MEQKKIVVIAVADTIPHDPVEGSRVRGVLMTATEDVNALWAGADTRRKEAAITVTPTEIALTQSWSVRLSVQHKKRP